MLSLFTAPSDWELASLCGLDDTFHETPRDLLFTFVNDPREWADGVKFGLSAPCSMSDDMGYGWLGGEDY